MDNQHGRRFSFPRRGRLDRDDHKETGTTDHGVVWADFEYRPEKPAA